MRGWGEGKEVEEYKRMKRRRVERKVWGREEEEVWKAGSSGRIAGGAPVTEEAPAFYHRLLPSFFHPSLLSGNRRDTQRGKERVLKIPPSFLCPSPLLKTCRLHSNSPCLHTELIQLVVMNVHVCVCVGDRKKKWEYFAAASLCLCISVPLCMLWFVFQGRGCILSKHQSNTPSELDHGNKFGKLVHFWSIWVNLVLKWKERWLVCVLQKVLFCPVFEFWIRHRDASHLPALEACTYCNGQ